MDYYVVVPVLLVLAAAGWIFYQHSETHRELALDVLARNRRMNWRFGLPAGLRDHLPRFRVIEKARAAGGEFQAGINTVTGERNGRKIAFFDFEWVTVSYYRRRGFLFSDEQERRRTHTRSAVAAELGCALQPVIIRPERLVDKAAALVGYDDIDFDSLPEFSRRFYVNSPDRAAARRLVTPTLARFFLDHVRCTVDFVGPWILVHRDSKLASGEVGPMLDLAERLAELVTREESGRPFRS